MVLYTTHAHLNVSLMFNLPNSLWQFSPTLQKEVFPCILLWNVRNFSGPIESNKAAQYKQLNLTSAINCTFMPIHT